MKREEKLKIGISIGDLNGIGGEIILKTFEDNRMLEFCTPVIFASVKVLSFLKKHFKSQINFHGVNNAKEALSGKVNVVNVWRDNVDIEFGQESLKAGEYSIKSLEAATNALKDGSIDVLVTAPINKHNIQSDKFNFPGHTDYLAKQLEGDSLMFMVTDSLKVGLLTDHVPLKDNGVIGNEDDETLRPTLKKIKEQGKLIYGPYAADSFFGSDNFKNFDAIVATYHDQGLIPFKTLSFGQGVNFTAGLSKVRTSPDHGTAYEIAGKGIADSGSFKEAVFTAIHIFNKRKEYLELSKNPLKKAPKKQ